MFLKSKKNQQNHAELSINAPPGTFNTSRLSRASKLLFVSARKNKKRTILCLIVVLAVIIISPFLLGQKSNIPEPVPLATSPVICDDNILSKAREVFQVSGSSEKLSVLGEQVRGLENYEKDGNCLYIATRCYIELGDPNKARSSLEETKKVQLFDKGFNEVFGETALTFEELENQVVFLETQQRRLEEGGSIPPSPRIEE